MIIKDPYIQKIKIKAKLDLIENILNEKFSMPAEAFNENPYVERSERLFHFFFTVIKEIYEELDGNQRDNGR